MIMLQSLRDRYKRAHGVAIACLALFASSTFGYTATDGATTRAPSRGARKIAVQRLSLRHIANLHVKRKYKLAVIADASISLGIQRAPMQLTATLDLEAVTKRVTRRGNLVMEISITGGVMRLFSLGGKQIERVGRQTITVTMTPQGQILNATGLATTDTFDALAGLDLISIAIGTLCVGLPDKPVSPGDAWSIGHTLSKGKRPVVAHMQLRGVTADATNAPIAHLLARYELPLEWLIPIELRQLYGLRATHKGTTQVYFNCRHGCVDEANGSVDIKLDMKIPTVMLPPELVQAVVQLPLQLPTPESANEGKQQGDAENAQDWELPEEDALEDAPPSDEVNDIAEGGEDEKRAEESDGTEQLPPPKLPERISCNVTIHAEFQLVRK